MIFIEQRGTVRASFQLAIMQTPNVIIKRQPLFEREISSSDRFLTVRPLRIGNLVSTFIYISNHKLFMKFKARIRNLFIGSLAGCGKSLMLHISAIKSESSSNL